MTINITGLVFNFGATISIIIVLKIVNKNPEVTHNKPEVTEKIRNNLKMVCWTFGRSVVLYLS